MGVLTSRPGDSDAGYSLKTTGKKHVDFRTGKGVQGPQFKAGQPGFASSNSVKTTHFFQINNGTILVWNIQYDNGTEHLTPEQSHI